MKLEMLKKFKRIKLRKILDILNTNKPITIYYYTSYKKYASKFVHSSITYNAKTTYCKGSSRVIDININDKDNQISISVIL